MKRQKDEYVLRILGDHWPGSDVSGSPGDMGPQGPNPPVCGDCGDNGDPGCAGPKGPKGPQGPKGEIGHPGYRGRKGEIFCLVQKLNWSGRYKPLYRPVLTTNTGTSLDLCNSMCTTIFNLSDHLWLETFKFCFILIGHPLRGCRGFSNKLLILLAVKEVP